MLAYLVRRWNITKKNTWGEGNVVQFLLSGIGTLVLGFGICFFVFGPTLSFSFAWVVLSALIGAFLTGPLVSLYWHWINSAMIIKAEEIAKLESLRQEMSSFVGDMKVKFDALQRDRDDARNREFQLSVLVSETANETYGKVDKAARELIAGEISDTLHNIGALWQEINAIKKKLNIED